jgi:hypothetical protein
VNRTILLVGIFFSSVTALLGARPILCDGDAGNHVHNQAYSTKNRYWCNVCCAWIQCSANTERQITHRGSGSEENKAQVNSYTRYPGLEIIQSDTIVIYDTVVITDVVSVPCPDIVVECPKGFMEYRNGDTIKCVPVPKQTGEQSSDPCLAPICIQRGIVVWNDTCNKSVVPNSKRFPIRWEDAITIKINKVVYLLRTVVKDGRTTWYLGAFRNGYIEKFKVNGKYDVWRQNIRLHAKGTGKFEPKDCRDC